MTVRSYIVKRTDRTSDGCDRYLVVRAHSVQEAMHQAAPARSAEPWEPATQSQHRLRWQSGQDTVKLATQPEAFPEIVSLGSEQTGEGCVYRSVPGTDVRALAERIFVALVAQRVGAAETANEAFALAEMFVAEAAKRGVQ